MGETVAERPQRDPEASSGRHGLGTQACQPRRLPTQPGALFGRDWEQLAIRHALLQEDVRLLTLWGPAGIGKTALALAVAAHPALGPKFDEVVFVDLAPVAEPSGVMPAILDALRIAPTPSRPWLDQIAWYQHTQDRRVLLVLDNLEHVVDAAPELVPLLVGYPSLRILATSRSALRLRWEHAFPVAPLAVPRAPFPSDAETAASYAGVALFVARACAARRDFQLTDANARVVAELCARLDGLPLALELAASRVKGLPLLVLLARLEDDRLAFLQAGAPDLPARQQTLRQALAWSYDLLDEPQQTLFRQLGVFVDGWTPEAAEIVCGPHPSLKPAEGREQCLRADAPVEPPCSAAARAPVARPFEERPGGEGAPGGDVLEGVAALVEASLVCLEEPPGSPPRYTMLATVRDYARRLLGDGHEALETRRRHAAYYLGLSGSDQAAPRLEHEHGNVQAAVEWAIEFDPSLLTQRPGRARPVSEPAGLEAARAPVSDWPQVVRVNGCLEEFTRREREVIKLAIHGWSNRQIANQLVISERTAEGHIHNILNKLQLDSRAQLAAWGVRAGLVRTDEPDSNQPRAPAALPG